ncbi:hypothetical protein ACGFIU_03095 [Rhodococcus oryzae]
MRSACERLGRTAMAMAPDTYVAGKSELADLKHPGSGEARER